MTQSPRRTALLIAGLYTAAAGIFYSLWFFLGDRLLEPAAGPPLHWQRHVVQDWGLSLVAGAVLFVLIRRTLAERARAHDELEARVQQRTALLAETNEALRAEVSERRRVEEALSRSEFKFRTVSDYTWDWEFWMDSDGRMLYVSPSCERISGYRAEEFCASPELLLQIAHPDDRASLSAVLLRSLAGEAVRGSDYRITAKDGGARWLSIALNPVPAPAGAPRTVRGSVRDISERLQAEEERARLWREVDANQRLLQAVFDHVPAGIAIFEGATLCVKWANPTYRQFLDERYRTAPITGLPVAEIIPRAVENGVIDTFRRVVSTGQPYIDAEYHYEGFARGITYWHWTLLPMPTQPGSEPDLLLLAIEITGEVLARKELEKSVAEIARQASQLDAMFTAMSDAVVIYDTAGRAIRANPAAIALLGLDPTKMRSSEIGQRLALRGPGAIRIAPQDLPPGRALRGEKVIGERLLLRNAGGKDLVINASAAPLLVNGRPIGAVSVVQDVTQREVLLNRLQQANTLLQEQAAELETRAREFAALLDISREVISTLQLQPLLGLILDRLKVLVDYTGAAVFVPRNDSIVIVEYRGPLPPEQVRLLAAPLHHAPIYQAAAVTRAPVIIPDLLADTEPARDYRERAAVQIRETLGASRSLMVVPLLVKNQMIGMLRLDALEPDFFTPHHAELAFAIANQAAIAMENARLYESAQSAAALEERQKLARDLHDSVSQALYGIVLGSHAARKMLKANSTEVEQTLGYVVTQAEAAVAEMRALIFELRPETLAREGLLVALSRQVEAARARFGVEIRANLCEEPDVSVEAKQALYRIAQEALHNALKHARPTLVELGLTCDARGTLLTICDNGAGFDPAGDYPGHMGLQSMRERAQRLGASFEIDSAPGRGTLIQLRLN